MNKKTAKKSPPSKLSRQEQDLERLVSEIVQHDHALTWMLCEISARKAKKMANQAALETA